jgi:hypothetical protein
VDLFSLQPREAAKRLFERATRANETSVRDTALMFATMALQGYAMLAQLDVAARLEVGILHTIVGEWDAALMQADTLFLVAPSHLYALGILLSVAAGRGDTDALRRADEWFLNAYDTERATNRAEYAAHDEWLRQLRQEAIGRRRR